MHQSKKARLSGQGKGVVATEINVVDIGACVTQRQGQRFTTGGSERQDAAAGIVNQPDISAMLHQQFDDFTVALACSYQQKAIAIAADLVDAGGVLLQKPGEKLVVTLADCQGKGVVSGFVGLLAINARLLQPLGQMLVTCVHRVQKQVVAIGVDPSEIGILSSEPLR